MKWCYSYKKKQGELKESRRDKDLCSTYYLPLFYWVLRYSDEQNRHGPHPLRPFHVVQESDSSKSHKYKSIMFSDSIYRHTSFYYALLSQPARLLCGILQARILEGLLFLSPGGLLNLGLELASPVLVGSEPPGKPTQVSTSPTNLSFIAFIHL